MHLSKYNILFIYSIYLVVGVEVCCSCAFSRTIPLLQRRAACSNSKPVHSSMSSAPPSPVLRVLSFPESLWWCLEDKPYIEELLSHSGTSLSFKINNVGVLRCFAMCVPARNFKFVGLNIHDLSFRGVNIFAHSFSFQDWSLSWNILINLSDFARFKAKKWQP